MERTGKDGDKTGQRIRPDFCRGVDVVTLDDRRLGYAIFTTVDSPATGLLKSRRFCYLIQIDGDPGGRGQGVGRALIRHVRETCRQAGIAKIELDV